MEVEQLRKEVKNPRSPVSPLFPSLPLFSITSGSSQSWDPKAEGGRWREQHKRQEREVCLWARGGRRGRLGLSPAGVPGGSPTACTAQRPSEVRPHPPPTACLSLSSPASVPTQSRTCFLAPSQSWMPTDELGLAPLFSHRFPRRERKSRITWRLKQETTLSSKASLRTRIPSRRKAAAP